MELFWKIWAGVAVGLLLLVSFIEVHGGRNGFQGANGLFFFVAGVLTLITSLIPFIVTWIWAGFWTAVKVCLIGAVAYAVLYAVMLKVLDRFARASR